MGRYWLAVATFQTFKAKALRHIVLFPVGDLLHSATFTVSQLQESWMDSFYACFISANWLIIHKSQTSSLVWPGRRLVAANAMSVCKLVSKLFFCLSNLNVLFFWGCIGGKGWWCLGITRADCSISKFLGWGRARVLCGGFTFTMC